MNWDIQNMITKIAGNHTLKAGFTTTASSMVETARARLYLATSPLVVSLPIPRYPPVRAPTGAVLMGEVGAPISTASSQLLARPRHHRFLPDDWKFSRRLTLTWAALERQQKPYERNDGHINFDPSARVPGNPFRRDCLRRPRWPAAFLRRRRSPNDFGPRFGFALMSSEQERPCYAAGTASSIHLFLPKIPGRTQLFSASSTSAFAQARVRKPFRFQTGSRPNRWKSPGARRVRGFIGQSVKHQ